MVHWWWYSEYNRICWRRRRAVAPRHSALQSPAWRCSADRRRLVEERQLRSRISSLLSSHLTTSLRMRQHTSSWIIAKSLSLNESVDVFARGAQTLLRRLRCYSRSNSIENRRSLPVSTSFVCPTSNVFVVMNLRLQFFSLRLNHRCNNTYYVNLYWHYFLFYSGWSTYIKIFTTFCVQRCDKSTCSRSQR